MKINLKQTFKNLKGEALINNDADGPKEVTLGFALSNIILSPHAQKKGFRPLRSWELAQKFYKDNEVDLDNSELTQIKEIIELGDHGYTALVSGQIMEMFINAESLQPEKEINKD